MAQQEETHKGFKIVIDTDKNELTIDSKKIDIIKEEDGKYSTSYMPYTNYGSILDLARHVIDKAPDFDTLSGS